MSESTLTALVDELRTAGVGVSVGEHLDAARALAQVPLADREVVRATLQSTLVKRAEHLEAFNLLFELHFAGTGSPISQPLADLADSELEAALRAAIESGDQQMLRQLAQEYVRRFARLEPGAPVAGVFAMIAASQAANLDAMRDDLLAAAARLRADDGTTGGAAGRVDGASEVGVGGADGAGGAEGAGGGGGSGGGWQAGSGAIQERL